MPRGRRKGREVIPQKTGFQTEIGNIFFSAVVIWVQRFLYIWLHEGLGKPTKTFFSQFPLDIAYTIGVENPLSVFNLKKYIASLYGRKGLNRMLGVLT